MEGVVTSLGDQETMQQIDDIPADVMGQAIPSWADVYEIQNDDWTTIRNKQKDPKLDQHKVTLSKRASQKPDKLNL